MRQRSRHPHHETKSENKHTNTTAMAGISYTNGAIRRLAIQSGPHSYRLYDDSVPQSRELKLETAAEIKQIEMCSDGTTVVLTNSGKVYIRDFNPSSRSRYLSSPLKEELETFAQKTNENFQRLKMPGNEIVARMKCSSDQIFVVGQKGGLFGWRIWRNLDNTMNQFTTFTPVIISSNPQMKVLDVFSNHSRTFVATTEGLYAEGELYAQLRASVCCSNYSHSKPSHDILGRETTLAKSSSRFFPIHEIQEPIKCVAVGSYHNIVLTRQGTVYGFGCNAWRQTGNPVQGHYRGHNKPTRITGDLADDIVRSKQVLALRDATLILTQEGRIRYKGLEVTNPKLSSGYKARDKEHEFQVPIIKLFNVAGKILALDAEGRMFAFSDLKNTKNQDIRQIFNISDLSGISHWLGKTEVETKTSADEKMSQEHNRFFEKQLKGFDISGASDNQTGVVSKIAIHFGSNFCYLYDVESGSVRKRKLALKENIQQLHVGSDGTTFVLSTAGKVYICDFYSKFFHNSRTFSEEYKVEVENFAAETEKNFVQLSIPGNEPIVSLDCKNRDFALAVGKNGKLFSFGGRYCDSDSLGRHNSFVPVFVSADDQVKVKAVFTGGCATFVATNAGMYGYNEIHGRFRCCENYSYKNKDDSTHDFSGVDNGLKSKTFLSVDVIHEPVRYAAIGLDHHVVVTTAGSVYGLGCSDAGQIGSEAKGHSNRPMLLEDKFAEAVKESKQMIARPGQTLLLTQAGKIRFFGLDHNRSRADVTYEFSEESLTQLIELAGKVLALDKNGKAFDFNECKAATDQNKPGLLNPVFNVSQPESVQAWFDKQKPKRLPVEPVLEFRRETDYSPLMLIIAVVILIVGYGCITLNSHNRSLKF